jgi:DNA-binding beta-propeller fold protein YncE
MRRIRFVTFAAVALMALSGFAQQASKHILSADELKKAVPAEYFYRGQKAPVQLRNAVGFQLADGKMTLASLVDASGYSTAIQQKYQGLLITETKLEIGGSSVPPGQYGFGFTADGKFLVMDVSNNDVLSTTAQTDSELKRPVPLKLVEDGAGYKLYAGKKWVSLKTE